MIVVTGGAGFIGSNLVAELEGRGETEIVICDRLRDGDKWRNISKREPVAIVFPEQLPEFLERNASRVRTNLEIPLARLTFRRVRLPVSSKHPMVAGGPDITAFYLKKTLICSGRGVSWW